MEASNHTDRRRQSAGKADQALSELFDDAILVASFGQRAGKFKDNSLFAAIRAAKAQEGLNWGSQEVADLQTALNNAIRELYPVTLLDLRNAWNPFTQTGDQARARTSRLMVAFIIMTSALLYACGYYTIWYKRSAELLESIAQAKAQKQSEVIYDIIDAMVTARGNVLLSTNMNPGDITYESIRQKVDEVREIDRELAADQNKYNQQFLTFVPARSALYSVLSWLNPIGASVFGRAHAGESAKDGTPAATPVALATGARSVAGSATPAPSGASDSASAGPQMWQPIGCDFSSVSHSPSLAVETQDPAARNWVAIERFNNFVKDNDTRVMRVRCALDIASTSPTIVYSNQIWVTRYLSERMELLGTWLLPAMYGALGALMFHMRAFIDPLLPNPNPARILLRVSLGSFAGIAVAWFLTPPISQGVGIANLGLGALAIAFLFGFSIDVFFTLLDRLVTITRNAISNLGTA